MYIGVDLGTTHSVISTIAEDGSIVLVPSKEGKDTIPSFIWVSQGENGKLKYVVGDKAYQRMKTDPSNVLFSYKTLIDQNIVLKEINGIKFSPITCSTLNLKYIVDTVREKYADKIEGAVVTVPAYFDESQKAATKGAAERAGLRDIYILPEPTAAAFAYGRIKPKPSNLLVFDLGGGTFDISILSVEPDKDGDPNVSVIGLGGDNHLGGYDIDRAIATYIISENKLKIRANDVDLMDELTAHAEALKIEISNGIVNKIPNPTSELDIILEDGKKKVPVKFTLDEETYRRIATPIIERAINKVIPALESVGVTMDMLDELILVGGSTRNPIVREELVKISGGKFTAEYFEEYKIHPDLAVGLGAGEYMKRILEKKNSSTSVVAKPIGIQLNDGSMEVIIRSNRRLPARATKSFTNDKGGEDELIIDVYEGFAKLAVSNTKLGSISVPVKPSPRNTHAVDVTLRVAADGTLEVESRVNMKKDKLIIKRDYQIESEALDVLDNQDGKEGNDKSKKDNEKSKVSTTLTKPISKDTKKVKKTTAKVSRKSNTPKESGKGNNKSEKQDEQGQGELEIKDTEKKLEF